jgi:hypothetical protein
MNKRTKRKRLRQGYVLYKGPSMLVPGKMIVVIITGLRTPSKNSKTGPMPQVFILLVDIHPWEAIVNRLDGAICGSCVHRMLADGTRSCYVNVMSQGVAAVWEAFTRGKYPMADDLALLGSNLRIRVGAYGDPAAVPATVWEQLLSQADGWTGYTHGWRKRPDLKKFFQASVDSEKEFFEAAALGWGTFRVRAEGAPLLASETPCPASEEEGYVATCMTCMKCNGQHHVSILAHGSGQKHFNNRSHRSLPILQGV